MDRIVWRDWRLCVSAEGEKDKEKLEKIYVFCCKGLNQKNFDCIFCTVGNRT